jgi:hypothetical protein
MKISELIEELQYYEKLNPDFRVKIYEYPGIYHSIKEIKFHTGTVLL